MAGSDRKENMSPSSLTYSCYFPENDWLKLLDKKIFFGHQSVGSNIMEGIGIIQIKNNLEPVNFIETIDSTDFRFPVFGHFRVGNILNPKSKIDSFKDIIDGGLGNILDIAFMKIGYPDINKNTDLNELFDYYKQSMESLQLKYPNLKLIHCTVSLTTKPTGIKGLAKVVLDMDNNVYRDKFNSQLRSYYNASELFDIARIQSTFPDGTSYSYRNGIPGMIPEMSSDGGHLSELGKVVAAKEMLALLLLQ
jgi:hypothetical protein